MVFVLAIVFVVYLVRKLDFKNCMEDGEHEE